MQQPGNGEERRTNNRQAQSLRDSLKFPTIRNYVEQWTTTTLKLVDWSEPDEWKKRLANTDKISPGIENRPFLEVLREIDIDDTDVRSFNESSRSSALQKRRLAYIEGFCAGAEFALRDTVPADPGGLQLEGIQEPIAWVSDRNWVDETLVGPRPNYPRTLDNNRLHLVLQKKRFPEDSQGDVVGPPRRIYITNPNGASIVSIIKTAPASQAKGFRDLFAGYITPTPMPKFKLRESKWWGGCFVIFFNLPYCGISTRELQDSRTISNGGKPLRRRQPLDFLHISKDHGLSGNESSSCPKDAFLHGAVFSLMVTGKSDDYWTAACLNDEFFGEEPRLASDDETLELDGNIDPILLKAEGGLTKPPRAYALAALAAALEEAVESHWNIEYLFRDSLNLHNSDAEDGSLEKISAKELETWIERFPKALNFVMDFNSKLIAKLDRFLEQDVMFSSDALPRGVLWRSLQNDPDALCDLHRIKEYRNDLKDIEGELNQMATACKEVRRKRQNDHDGEQQSIAKQVCQLTIASFVSTIPNTVAQLYSGKPGPGSWPSYVAVMMFCFLVGVATAVYLFWPQVQRAIAFLSRICRRVRDRLNPL